MIREIVDLIDKIVYAIAECDMGEYGRYAQIFIDRFIEIVPNIIAVYYEPNMSDIAKDAVYWPSQVEKIISALENGDDIATFDILYCDTRRKLLELEAELIKRGDR